MKKLIMMSAMGCVLALTSASQARAEEVVIQAPYVTVRLGAGGPGGVIVDVPFFRVRVPPRMAGPSMRAPGLELLPPPLAAPAGNDANERIPPGMLPPPVPVPPPDDEDDKPVTKQPARPTAPPLEKLPPPTPPGAEAASPRRSPDDVAAKPSALSLADFAKTFQPTAGVFDVEILHPDTQKPVRVQFTLPAEPIRRVHVGRHEIEFKYRRQEVKIRFKHDGTVKVEDRE